MQSALKVVRELALDEAKEQMAGEGPGTHELQEECVCERVGGGGG